MPSLLEHFWNEAAKAAERQTYLTNAVKSTKREAVWRLGVSTVGKAAKHAERQTYLTNAVKSTKREAVWRLANSKSSQACLSVFESKLQSLPKAVSKNRR